ncbi:MAG: hypothetical protein RIR26_2292 [Pseudomonadota bacterium]|jgi:hypothetical protein
MLFRATYILVTLVVMASFLGWVKSGSKTPDSPRFDEMLSLNTLVPQKKPKIIRRQVADTTP